MIIKNAVFDLGNVLVKWDPYAIIRSIFPQHDPDEIHQQMRAVWVDLNLGKCTEHDAIVSYQQIFGVTEEQVVNWMKMIKTSQTPLPGSFELLHKLHAAGVPLYALTDNTKAIMEYHLNHSNFLHYFRGIVVSADVGVLKPNPGIYQYLLDQYNLNPVETVFIDDLMCNVEGARAVGMIESFQFKDAASCKIKLVELGIIKAQYVDDL